MNLDDATSFDTESNAVNPDDATCSIDTESNAVNPDLAMDTNVRQSESNAVNPDMVACTESESNAVNPTSTTTVRGKTIVVSTTTAEVCNFKSFQDGDFVNHFSVRSNEIGPDFSNFSHAQLNYVDALRKASLQALHKAAGMYNISINGHRENIIHELVLRVFRNKPNIHTDIMSGSSSSSRSSGGARTSPELLPGRSRL